MQSPDSTHSLAGTLHDPDPDVRHPDLWFDDGSIILRAQHILYRVHASLLSRKSQFFRDMFSLPQPPKTDSLPSPDGQAYLDGCPLVCLHDTAEDVSSMLKAMYDGPLFGNNDRNDFRVVAGVLRLSTKYFAEELRKKSLAHLHIAWPTSLKGWDAREDIARAYEMEHALHSGLFYPSPVAVINLAREIDAPSLLPAAFYDLSRYHYTQIFEPSDDEPLHPSRSSPFSPSSPSFPPTLSAPDLRKLALGKEASQHAITNLIQAMGRSPYRDSTGALSTPQSHRRTASQGRRNVCVSAAACRKDFSELVELATQHYLFDRERGCADPLYVAEELGQLKSAEMSECKACARSLESWAQRERERMWKLIPLWFRLEA